MNNYDMANYKLPKLKDEPIPEENYLRSFISRAVPIQPEMEPDRKCRRTKSISDHLQRYNLDPLRCRSDDNIIVFHEYQSQMLVEKAAADLQRRHTNTLDPPFNSAAVEPNQNPSPTADFSVDQSPDRSSVAFQDSSDSSVFLGGSFFGAKDALQFVPVRDISDDNLSLKSQYSETSAIDPEIAAAAAAAAATTTTDSNSEGLSPTTDTQSSQEPKSGSSTEEQSSSPESDSQSP
jgi:hypothetical protein